MKRKTNLFYKTGQDSNFITFSSYAECLTGNHFVGNSMIYVSNFLCLDIENLYDTDGKLDLDFKAKFIEHLCGHYENKLAFLRDYCVSNNLSIEENIHPLNWLIESIDEFFGTNTFKDSLKYIGGIVENNYGGAYSDCILTIDNIDNDITDCDLIQTSTSENIDCDEENLHGWIQSELSKINVFIDPVYDYGTSYNIKPKYENIVVTKNKISSENKDLKFNVIIPLFDCTNINADKELITYIFNTKNNQTTINLNVNNSILSTGNTLVPYGIWFSGENPVELKYDSISKNRTCWSLTLSSQYKAFPYMNKDVEDKYFDKRDPGVDPFTFAEVLKGYNRLSDSLNKMFLTISSLESQIAELRNRFNNIGINGNDSEDYLLLNDKLVELESKLNSIESAQALSSSWDEIE